MGKFNGSKLYVGRILRRLQVPGFVRFISTSKISYLPRIQVNFMWLKGCVNTVCPQTTWEMEEAWNKLLRALSTSLELGWKLWLLMAQYSMKPLNKALHFDHLMLNRPFKYPKLMWKLLL